MKKQTKRINNKKRKAKTRKYYGGKNSLDKKNSHDKKDENNEKDCNICIECFNKGDNIVKLNCKHEFHKDCIKKWLCNNSTKCPVCRVEVAKGKANL